MEKKKFRFGPELSSFSDLMRMGAYWEHMTTWSAANINDHHLWHQVQVQHFQVQVQLKWKVSSGKYIVQIVIRWSYIEQIIRLPESFVLITQEITMAAARQQVLIIKTCTVGATIGDV